MKKLHKAQEKLKHVSHVNKKAFQQYENFTEQKQTLQTREEGLDKSQSAIEELIQVLDQRKDEAIERTFKQVSKNFADIFEKLVPNGIGRLVMQTKMEALVDESNDVDEAMNEQESRARSVENYVGVAIKVSFNSKHDEQQRIQQLSGGQKSLCALTLIFAIQKCDPAPFYLFDEIDANLDAQYRRAVAAIIEELSRDAQFICTTFRPEMIHVGNKFYGIAFQKKVSSAHAISREEAMAFIEQDKA